MSTHQKSEEEAPRMSRPGGSQYEEKSSGLNDKDLQEIERMKMKQVKIFSKWNSPYSHHK